MSFPLYRVTYAYEAEGVEIDRTVDYNPEPSKVMFILPGIMALCKGVTLEEITAGREEHFTLEEVSAEDRAKYLKETRRGQDWEQPEPVNTNPAGV